MTAVATLAPAGGQAPQVQALAHQRFVESFVVQSSRSQLSLLPISALVAWVWHEVQPGALPWLWLLTACAYSLWRHFSTAQLVHVPDTRASTRRIGWMLLATGALQAVPLASFAEQSDAGRGMLTLILVTLATVSVITTSGLRISAHRGRHFRLIVDGVSA